MNGTTSSNWVKMSTATWHTAYVRSRWEASPRSFRSDHRDEPEWWNTARFGDSESENLQARLFRSWLAKPPCQRPIAAFRAGKWYPGESLPRWGAVRCYWRKDTEPVWTRPDLIADDDRDYGYDDSDAREFIPMLAEQLQVRPGSCRARLRKTPGTTFGRRGKLPVNVDPFESKLDNEEDRARLARVFEQGLASVVGYVLPLMPNEFVEPFCFAG